MEPMVEQLGEIGAAYRLTRAAQRTLAHLQAVSGAAQRQLVARVWQAAQRDLSRMPAGSQARRARSADVSELFRALRLVSPSGQVVSVRLKGEGRRPPRPGRPAWT